MMHEAQSTATDATFGQTTEDSSKDAFFAEVGDVAQRMIEKHGKDFAMGVLIIGARFIAEGKPLTRPK